MAGSARLSSRGDQAELAGILNTLYELHLPVLPENSYHTQSSRQPFIMMM